MVIDSSALLVDVCFGIVVTFCVIIDANYVLVVVDDLMLLLITIAVLSVARFALLRRCWCN